MAAHLFNRYVWLLDQVSRGGKKFKDISEAWETNYLLNDRPGEPLPKKTFYNHIKAIEEMFGICIRCQRIGGYVYVIEENEDTEISQMQHKLLNQLLISNIHLEQKHAKYVIMPKMSLHKFVTTIFEAISQSRKIRILWGWDDGENSMEDRWVEIAPFYVKGFVSTYSDEDTDWFVYGLGNRGVIQVYDLANIKNIEVLDESYVHSKTPFDKIVESVSNTPLNPKDADDSIGACFNSHKESGEYKNIFDE